MVSFQCEGCGDVFTKKKLDAHANRCRNAGFTCLDCHVSFYGTEYRSHTSCISEAQKYQGHLYQEKKGPKSKQNKPPAPTVEDFNESTVDLSKSVTFEKAEIPPPAPTPPSANPPVNVFDFLEKSNDEQDESDSSDSSSFVSADDDSDTSELRGTGAPEHEAHTGGHQAYTYGQQVPPYSQPSYPGQGYPPAYGYPYYAYGTTPQNGATPQMTPYSQPPKYHISDFETPAQPSTTPQVHEPQSESRSDKKRKRSPSGIDTAAAADDRVILHTGLTGGLNRLLPSDEESARAADGSPLSPKKRSKRNREESLPALKEKSKEEERAAKRKEKHQRSEHAMSMALTTTTASNKERKRSRKALEAGPVRKAIEYPGHGARKVKQAPYQAKSDFFLSLIDKDHKSVRGQSIWGLLKMFHESRQEGSGLDEDACRAEEKKLLKGLRCKMNKHGDGFILFSRSEAEGE